MTPSSDHKAAERAVIARAAQAFFKSGGQVQKLPGPTLAPLPPRSHPKPKPKRKRPDLVAAHVRRYRECGPEVMRLFERGDTFKQIGEAVGHTANFVLSCLDYFGIDGKRIRAEQKEEAQQRDVEAIATLARDGHSMAFAAGELTLSISRVRYLSDRHGIRFSGRGE